MESFVGYEQDLRNTLGSTLGNESSLLNLGLTCEGIVNR